MNQIKVAVSEDSNHCFNINFVGTDAEIVTVKFKNEDASMSRSDALDHAREVLLDIAWFDEGGAEADAAFVPEHMASSTRD